MKLYWKKGPMSWIAYLEKPEYGNNFNKSKCPPIKDIEMACNKLLAMGGNRIVFMISNEEFSISHILNGTLIEPTKVIVKSGLPSQCHFNAAKLWLKRRKTTKIVSGHVLSNDGCWRPHSWLITNRNYIIESTERRKKYFGFIHDDEMGKIFCTLIGLK